MRKSPVGMGRWCFLNCRHTVCGVAYFASVGFNGFLEPTPSLCLNIPHLNQPCMHRTTARSTKESAPPLPPPSIILDTPHFKPTMHRTTAKKEGRGTRTHGLSVSTSDRLQHTHDAAENPQGNLVEIPDIYAIAQ